MKKYLLHLFLSTCFIACTIPKSSEELEPFITATNEKATAVIQTLTNKMAGRGRAMTKPNYAPILETVDSLRVLTAAFCQRLENESVVQEVIQLQEVYINSVKSLWNNGGISRTVFRDENRQKASLEYLQASLNVEELGMLDASLISSRQCKNKARRMEYAVVQFLLAQIPFAMSYERWEVASFSPSSNGFIYLGDTFQTDLVLHECYDQQLTGVMVNNEGLEKTAQGLYVYEKDLDRVGVFDVNVAVQFKGQKALSKHYKTSLSYQVNP